MMVGGDSVTYMKVMILKKSRNDNALTKIRVKKGGGASSP